MTFQFNAFAKQDVDCRAELEGIHYHNAEVQAAVSGDFTRDQIYTLTERLIDAGTFAMQISPQGFVAAADVGNHPGDYGRFFWLRDMARVYAGQSDFHKLLEEMYAYKPNERLKSALEKSRAETRSLALGLLKVLSDPKFFSQALANILDPSWHEHPENGFKNVIWVRRLLAPFNEGRPPTPEEDAKEAKWAHKQNDALALLGHAVLDALNSGDLSFRDLTQEAQANLLLLPAYFLRLEYWRMFDAGAWEETLAVHTSSVSLVTSFLERFNKGLNYATAPGDHSLEAAFFRELSETGFTSLEKQIPDIKSLGIVEDSLLPQVFAGGIAKAYDVLSTNLLVGVDGRATESAQGDANGLRREDTAMLHGLWYPLLKMDRKKTDQWVGDVDSLRRQSGYARYANDWFLHGAIAATFAQQLDLVGKMIIFNADGKLDIGDAQKLNEVSTEYEKHFLDKEMTKVVQYVGAGHEAQWTLPDSILAQFYADRALRTISHEDLMKAIEHLRRASGQLTGEGEVTVEGKPVIPLRMPEAYIQVKTLTAQGTVETRLYVSPNSPLNWSTAEYQSALLKVSRAVKKLLR